MKKQLKKDFDKEQMYAKIMPSFQAQGGQGAGQAGPEPEDLPPAPQPRFLLRNYMEDVLLEKITHTMEMLKACNCEKCKKDVLAMALNELPSAYMAVEPERVDQAVRELRAHVEVKASSALIKAVQAVKAHPSH